MQLRADDFGCVPDGRVLDKVAVLADSSQLDVLDGTLRPGRRRPSVSPSPAAPTSPPPSPNSSAGRTAKQRWTPVMTN